MNSQQPSPSHPDDHGAATVEIAGWTTLMLLALLFGVQVVAWGYATLGAHYTASHAAQTARIHGGNNAAAHADADRVLASTVGNGLRDPTVTITRNSTTVTVTVTGTAPPLVPHLHLPVAATITAELERLT